MALRGRYGRPPRVRIPRRANGTANRATVYRGRSSEVNARSCGSPTLGRPARPFECAGNAVDLLARHSLPRHFPTRVSSASATREVRVVEHARILYVLPRIDDRARRGAHAGTDLRVDERGSPFHQSFVPRQRVAGRQFSGAKIAFLIDEDEPGCCTPPPSRHRRYAATNGSLQPAPAASHEVQLLRRRHLRHAKDHGGLHQTHRSPFVFDLRVSHP